MDINLKWVAIGGILVILLIAFGRNPVEEGRQRRAEAMKGKDPLVHAIEEHNKAGGDGLSRGRSMGRMGRGEVPEGAIDVTPQYNKNSQQDFVVPTPPAAPQNQGYYPPPAAPSDTYVPPGNTGAPRSDNLHRLPDGRLYSSYGTKMYTVDARGDQIPLPDGKYPIAGGKLHIVIENGEKVAITP